MMWAWLVLSSLGCFYLCGIVWIVIMAGSHGSSIVAALCHQSSSQPTRHRHHLAVIIVCLWIVLRVTPTDRTWDCPQTTNNYTNNIGNTHNHQHQLTTYYVYDDIFCVIVLAERTCYDVIMISKRSVVPRMHDLPQPAEHAICHNWLTLHAEIHIIRVLQLNIYESDTT